MHPVKLLEHVATGGIQEAGDKKYNRLRIVKFVRTIQEFLPSKAKCKKIEKQQEELYAHLSFKMVTEKLSFNLKKRGERYKS